MSANGPGDDEDDIDKLLRELRDTNANLEELVDNLGIITDAMKRQARQELGEDEVESVSSDLWQQGEASPGHAGDVDEYIKLRRKTADSPNISVPQIDVGVDLVDLFFDLYRMYGEHLNRIEKALSKDDWKEFVQRLAVLYGVDQELVDILNPGPSVFGITTVGGDLKILESKTHMNFREQYGSIWFRGAANLGPVAYENPSSSLLLPEDEGFTVIIGHNDARDIHAKMAKAIEERKDLSLPEKYRGLL